METNKLQPISETEVFDINKLTEKQLKSISILKRQTDYDEETIIKKIKEFDNNIEKIILDYNNIDIEKRKKQEFSNLTTNQKIFKSIRDFF
jgi:hypothetical protein